MTIQDWLLASITLLKQASIPTARLDAEVLLADALNKDRSWIHAHPDFTLQRSDLRKLDEQVERRVSHEPLAYIRGKQEFFGHDFEVTPDTLTPRPETEDMIDLLLNTAKNLQPKANNHLPTHHPSPITILDIGTGSGCIAITAKLELPGCAVYATDISAPALTVAEKNTKKHSAKVTFITSDLLSSVPIAIVDGSILCCNLPYVPDDYQINTAAKHEPKIALFSGEDGLNHYRELFQQLKSMLPDLKNPPVVLTESLPFQHAELEKIAVANGYILKETAGLVQKFTQ